jgi:hypothetical protein
MIKDFLCNHTDISVEKTTVKSMNYVYGNSTAAYKYDTATTADDLKLELPTIGYRVVASKPATVKVVAMPKKVEAPQLKHQYSNAG